MSSRSSKFLSVSEDVSEDLTASAPASTADLPTRYFLMQKEPPSKILPYLYVGSRFTAIPSRLEEQNIKYVLNVRDCFYGNPPAGIKFLHVPMSDNGIQDIKGILEKCFDFIDEGRNRNQNVLVHCSGGVSRSVTVVIAYLMVKQKYSLKAAYKHVKSCRPQISPKEEYIVQLQQLEKSLTGKITLTIEDAGPSFQERQRRALEELRLRRRNNTRRLDASSESSELIASAPPQPFPNMRHTGILNVEFKNYRRLKANATDNTESSLEAETSSSNERNHSAPPTLEAMPSSDGEQSSKSKKISAERKRYAESDEPASSKSRRSFESKRSSESKRSLKSSESKRSLDTKRSSESKQSSESKRSSETKRSSESKQSSESKRSLKK